MNKDWERGYMDYLKDPNGRHCTPADEPDRSHYFGGWEQAKFDKDNQTVTVDWTKPIQTRGGLKARVLTTDRKGTAYPVVALIEVKAGNEQTNTYTLNGLILTNSTDPYDIINVPPEPVKKSAWLNVYPSGTAFSYPTKERADDVAGTNREACVFIEYTL